MAKFNKKTKVLEFRIAIPFEDFLNADEKVQISLILDAIEKTIDMMSKFKVPSKDRGALRNAVVEARARLSSATNN